MVCAFANLAKLQVLPPLRNPRHLIRRPNKTRICHIPECYNKKFILHTHKLFPDSNMHEYPETSLQVPIKPLDRLLGLFDVGIYAFEENCLPFPAHSGNPERCEIGWRPLQRSIHWGGLCSQGWVGVAAAERAFIEYRNADVCFAVKAVVGPGSLLSRLISFEHSGVVLQLQTLKARHEDDCTRETYL